MYLIFPWSLELRKIYKFVAWLRIFDWSWSNLATDSTFLCNLRLKYLATHAIPCFARRLEKGYTLFTDYIIYLNIKFDSRYIYESNNVFIVLPWQVPSDKLKHRYDLHDNTGKVFSLKVTTECPSYKIKISLGLL